MENLERPIDSVDALLEYLRQRNGFASFFENEPLLSYQTVQDAKAGGLVKTVFGNGWDTDVSIHLTEIGRERCGLPPTRSWLERLQDFIKR